MSYLPPGMEPIFPSFFGKYPIDYDPATKVTLEVEARTNPYMRIMLSQNVTGLVTQYMRRNVQRSSFVVVQIAGRSESGKSYLSLALAIWLQRYIRSTKGVSPRIFIAWYWSDLLRMMKKTREYDIIICDEESELTGQESKTDRTRLYNILESCRKRRVSFFFNSPEVNKKPNVHMVFRVIAKVPAIWHTIAMLYTGDGYLMGLVVWPIPQDEEALKIYYRYEGLKDKYIQQLVDYEGGTDPNVAEKQWDYAEQLYKVCKKYIRSGVKWTEAKVAQWLTEVPGLAGETGEFKRGVIGRVMAKWNSELKGDVGVDRVFVEEATHPTESENPDVDNTDTRTDVTPSIDTQGSVLWKMRLLREERLPDDFPAMFSPHLHWAARQHNTTASDEEKITDYMVDAYIMWLSGISQSDIAFQIRPRHIANGGRGCSQAMISLWLTHVGKTIVGYALESYLSRGSVVVTTDENGRRTYDMGTDGIFSDAKGYRWGGLNKSAPDFESDEKIVSVKARTTMSIQADPSMVGQEEKRIHLKTGKPIELIIYELRYQRVFRVYLVTLEQNTQTIDAVDVESVTTST